MTAKHVGAQVLTVLWVLGGAGVLGARVLNDPMAQ